MHSQINRSNAGGHHDHWRRVDLLRFLGSLQGPIEQQGSYLLEIPQQELIELLDDSHRDVWQLTDRTRLYRLLLVDVRPAVRSALTRAIGASLGGVSPEYVEELLVVLAGDFSREVRAAVPAVFAAWLDTLEAADQAAVIERWATSPVAEVRIVVARTLARHVSIWCSEHVLSLLSTDGDDEVRLATAIAAGSRLAEDPDFYGEILDELAVDGDPAIRHVARRSIGGMAWTLPADDDRADDEVSLGESPDDAEDKSDGFVT